MKTNIFKIAVITLIVAVCSFSCNQKEFDVEEVEIVNSVVKSGVEKEFFYTDRGEKEYFNTRTDRMIIKAKSSEGAKSLSNQGRFISAYNVGDVFVIANVDPSKTKPEVLRQMPDVDNFAFGLEYADGVLQFPSDRIFVKPKEAAALDKMFERIGLKKGVETIDIFDKQNDIYMVTLNVELEDILQICRDLYETGLCKFAEPSFYRETKPHNTYFSSQWGLKNTGQSGGKSGIDINAEPAWVATKGSSTIKVAVIDEGVQLNHPDLQANLLTGYDAIPSGSNPGGANGSPYSTNNHGTLCAGVIAAIDNSIGIIGVAPSVKIIPVRIAYTPTGSNTWVTNDTWIVNGINYAWNTANADVLSSSWGGGSSSTAINTEINNAIVNGRLIGSTRYGCTVVFASGNNSSSSVSYPASLSYVIAAGAINRNGQRASFSNYGSALDVVAPGQSIITTDIGGNYATVDGTSFAAPHVAGVAALLLSFNPNLTQAQVRFAIESKCTKLSGYSYSSNSSHPNGTWNSETGHGLVNAYASLLIYYTPPTLTPSTSAKLFCSGSSFNITVNNPPASYTWDYSNNVSLSGSGNTRTVTASSTSGSGWVSIKSGSLTLVSYGFWVGKPDVSISGPTYVEASPYNSHTYYANVSSSNSGVSSYNWLLPGGNGAIYGYGNYANAYFYNEATYRMECQATNTCGTASAFHYITAYQ